MGQTQTFKQYLTKFIVWLMKFAGLLALPTASKIGRYLGKAAWYLAPTPRRVTLTNIRLCFPDLSPEQQTQLAKESIRETVQTAFELLSAWAHPPQDSLKCITHVENEQLLHDAYATGRGVVLIVPHFGNWELTNFYVGQLYPLLAMYKPAELETIDEYILHARSQTTQMIKADKRGVISLFKALRKGGIVGVLPDQEPTSKTGVWVPFFGIEALTPRLISKLVQDTNAIALSFCCQRNPDNESYHLFFSQVDNSIYNKDITVSARALNQCIEDIILRCPSQYQWEYKRFKRRPTGEPRFY